MFTEPIDRHTFQFSGIKPSPNMGVSGEDKIIDADLAGGGQDIVRYRQKNSLLSNNKLVELNKIFHIFVALTIELGMQNLDMVLFAPKNLEM